IFQEAGLPLSLRPYEVLVTSSYTALIETIPDTGNFVESMAGYSLVCYFLQSLTLSLNFSESLTLSRRRDRRLRRSLVSTPHTTGRRSPLAATAALAIRAAPSPSAPLQSAAPSRQSKFNHLRLIMAAARWIGSKLEVKNLKPTSLTAGTTTPTSAKVGNIIEILDSDDESTPPKIAPETAQPHPDPSPSIKDRTFVLKRISPSDTSTNHNSCPDVKKITRPQDTIHGSKPASAAQQKLGSPPPSSRSSQVKETTDAGQYSQCKMLLDLASQLPSSSSSSSSSSDSEFDLDLEISYNPVL
ncbi:Phosphatidylinositol 4-kinase beta 1, partial [Linum perenne]